jgi:hypothetical protein
MTMRPYLVTARTAILVISFSTRARCSADVAVLTAALLGDQACGVTVVPEVR